MKTFQLIVAATLAAALSAGTAIATEATDSTKASTVVTNNGYTSTVTVTTTLPKNKKKSSSKRHAQTDSIIPEAEDSIVAFSYTATFPNDSVDEEDEQRTVIALQDTQHTIEDHMYTLTQNMLAHLKEIAWSIFIVLLLVLAIPALLVVLLIYLLRRSSRKTHIDSTTETVSPTIPRQPDEKAANTAHNVTNPSTATQQNATPATEKQSIHVFQGLLFDETTLTSGIKYTMTGLGMLIATLFIHGASFFIWVSIVLFFIGIGKILIALLPNLKYRETNVAPENPNIQAQAADTTADKQAATPADNQPAASKREEKPEDYMPSSSEEKEA